MSKILTPDELLQRQLELALDKIFQQLIDNWAPGETVLVYLEGVSWFPWHLYNQIIDLLRENHWRVIEVPESISSSRLIQWNITSAKEAHSSDTTK